MDKILYSSEHTRSAPFMELFFLRLALSSTELSLLNLMNVKLLLIGQ